MVDEDGRNRLWARVTGQAERDRLATELEGQSESLRDARSRLETSELKVQRMNQALTDLQWHLTEKNKAVEALEEKNASLEEALRVATHNSKEVTARISILQKALRDTQELYKERDRGLKRLQSESHLPSNVSLGRLEELLDAADPPSHLSDEAPQEWVSATESPLGLMDQLWRCMRKVSRDLPNATEIWDELRDVILSEFPEDGEWPQPFHRALSILETSGVVKSVTWEEGGGELVVRLEKLSLRSLPPLTSDELEGWSSPLAVWLEAVLRSASQPGATLVDIEIHEGWEVLTFMGLETADQETGYDAYYEGDALGLMAELTHESKGRSTASSSLSINKPTQKSEGDWLGLEPETQPPEPLKGKDNTSLASALMSRSQEVNTSQALMSGVVLSDQVSTPQVNSETDSLREAEEETDDVDEVVPTTDISGILIRELQSENRKPVTSPKGAEPIRSDEDQDELGASPSTSKDDATD